VIKRQHHIAELSRLLHRFPVVALIGARQVGKTTLARQFAASAKGPLAFFDLEHPADIARLADPMLALQSLRGTVIIDEIQRLPELFSPLRVLADRKRGPARFLVLGSASPALLQQSSESLAGRIAYYELDGFGLDEIGAEHFERLWIRGGFPSSYLARSASDSAEWRRNFIRTFLERDIPQLGISIKAATLYRFWSMLAHYHGQIWNSSEFARSFGLADTTIRKYLDLLSDAFVVRQLLPWSENLKKRQIRSPKVYVRDSGLLHTLLGLETSDELERHPKVGASWEGFLIEQLLRHLDARREEIFFWGTHTGAELDLLIVRGRRKIGFEIKRSTAPAMTPSMRSTLHDLGLQKLYVVHAGKETFPLQQNVTAVSVHTMLDDIPKL